jgi:hypothetical protein
MLPIMCGLRWTLATILSLAGGLGSGACAADAAVGPPVVHAMPPPAEAARGQGEPVVVRLAGGASIADAARAMGDGMRRGNVPCYKAIFVWGGLHAMGEARPMQVAVGGASISGFVLCEENLPEFLAAQKDNPRLAGKRGGSSDLRWADGQLYMRRSWGNGEAPLGDLSADESTVLQKGELLAAVFDPLAARSDATAGAEVIVAALSRVPKFFLFGMWPLPAH